MPAQLNSATDLQRMSTKPTLVRPPSPDHGKAEIEHILELTQLSDIDPVCPPVPVLVFSRSRLTSCTARNH